jgi:hypothetical protein
MDKPIIKDSAVFLDSKLHFHQHLNVVSSEAFKLSCLIYVITFYF